MVLPVATVLDQHYEIQRPLDSSPPFSVLYLGREIETGRSVHIQEYFPEFLAHRAEGDVRIRPVDDTKKASLYRTGMDYFRKEAGVLSALSHPNLIEEQAPLAANGTLYRVRPVRPGLTLARGIEKKGYLSLQAALTVLKPIIGALETAHQRGLLHGGVAPEAIYLQKQGGPLLRHFRSASIQLARRAGRLGDVVLPGISPIEQYAPEGEQGPWTDVYSLAATMVWIVAGERLPEAPQRAENDDVAGRLASIEAFTGPLREVLMRALAIPPKKRIRSISTLHDALQQALHTKTEALQANDAGETASDEGDHRSAAVEENTPAASANEDADHDSSDEPVADDEPAISSEPAASGLKTASDEQATSSEQAGSGEQAAAEKEATPEPSGEKPPLESNTSSEDDLSKTEKGSSSEKSPRQEEPREAPLKGGKLHEEASEDSAPSRASKAVPETASSSNEPEENLDDPPSTDVREDQEKVQGDDDPDPLPVSRPSTDRAPADRAPADRMPVPSEQASAAPSNPETTDKREGSGGERKTVDTSTEHAEGKETNRSGENPSGLKKSRRLVQGALPVVALVLIGAIAVWVWPSASGTADSYRSYRAQADSLYDQAEYAEAKTLYAQALQARPEDAYAAQRLVRIEEQQATRRKEAYERHLAEGDSLAARADSLLQGQDSEAASAVYQQAGTAYRAALDVQPGDPKAAARLESIDSLLNTIGDNAASIEESTLDAGQLFTLYRAQGDQALEAGNYRVAERKYEEALEYRPDSTSVRERLEAVRNRIDQEERQIRHADIVARADSLFDAERYIEAEVQYQQALALLPDDSLAAARVQEIDSLLAEQDRREQQYQYHRGRGDVLFDQEDYAEAITSYQRALEYRSDDEYVQNRIAESQQALEAQRRAEQKRREEQQRLAEQKRREAEARKRERMQENGVYVIADQAPELIGSLAALHEKIKYPSRAVQRGIEGRIYLQVVINKDGTVREASVTRGIGGGCDEEALRVVKQAEFTPAKVDGEPVPYRHTLWVQFKLEGRQQGDADA